MITPKRPPRENPDFSPSAPPLKELEAAETHDSNRPRSTPDLPKPVPPPRRLSVRSSIRGSALSRSRRSASMRLTRSAPMLRGFNTTPPVPPPRHSLRMRKTQLQMKTVQRETSCSTRSGLQPVSSFGAFSDAAMQTGHFKQPSCVAACSATGDVAVVDSAKMTVQVFNAQHAYRSMFKHVGVTGACFVSTSELALATTDGLVVCRTSGQLVTRTPLGRRLVAVDGSLRGCVAASIHRLFVFDRRDFSKPERCIKSVSFGAFKFSKKFKNISGVSVAPNGNICVLDSRSHDETMLYVISDRGRVRESVCVQAEGGGFLRNPRSIATDRWSNVIMCDASTNCVVRFSSEAKFAQCLVSGETRPTTNPTSANETASPQAVGVERARDVMHVAMAAYKTARIDQYELRHIQTTK